MRILGRRLIRQFVAGLLCACLWPALHAAAGVRELPTTPTWKSIAGKDYRLRPIAVAGRTVTLIDVHSDPDDWLRPDAAKLPPRTEPPAPTLQTQLEWFYGEIAGWMPVPTGWHLQRASIGVDGGTIYTFVAPSGAASGWISYTVIPACVGCLLKEANGLLPGAGERLGADRAAANLGQTNPVMDWQSHPDECTALFRYRSGGLTVHAAVLSSIPITVLANDKRSLAVASLYAALPTAASGLAGFLSDRFRQAFPACNAPNGWSG